MGSILRFRVLCLVVLVLASGCQAPKASDATTAAATSSSVNRDKHGPADLGGYIQKLQSTERVADLQVDVVLEKLKLPADALIGDLGCGPGVFSLAFAK